MGIGGKTTTTWHKFDESLKWWVFLLSGVSEFTSNKGFSCSHKKRDVAKEGTGRLSSMRFFYGGAWTTGEEWARVTVQGARGIIRKQSFAIADTYACLGYLLALSAEHLSMPRVLVYTFCRAHVHASGACLHFLVQVHFPALVHEFFQATLACFSSWSFQMVAKQ